MEPEGQGKCDVVFCPPLAIVILAIGAFPTLAGFVFQETVEGIKYWDSPAASFHICKPWVPEASESNVSVGGGRFNTSWQDSMPQSLALN